MSATSSGGTGAPGAVVTSAASLDVPAAAFGLREQRSVGWTLSQEQLLTAAVTDHRGRVEFPSYAVLLDFVGGGPNCVVDGEDIWTVTSRLSMSAGAPPGLGVILASSHVLHRDDSSTTTSFTVTDPNGATVCAGNGRTVVIGRGRAEESVRRPCDPVQIPAAATEWSGESFGDLDGAEIVASMASGDLDIGPLGRLLGVRVEFGGEYPVVRVTAAPWMANSIGTMHGGVITAVMGHSCGLAGQARTQANQDYRLADMSVNFFRSPPVAGADLVIRTQPVRVGRRISTIAASMSDDAGTVYAYALADIHFR